MIFISGDRYNSDHQHFNFSISFSRLLIVIEHHILSSHNNTGNLFTFALSENITHCWIQLHFHIYASKDFCVTMLSRDNRKQTFKWQICACFAKLLSANVLDCCCSLRSSSCLQTSLCLRITWEKFLYDNFQGPTNRLGDVSNFDCHMALVLQCRSHSLRITILLHQCVIFN